MGLNVSATIVIALRTKNLLDCQLEGGVFVCTNVAVRGIGIPNISHIIQAEFAASVVDFLNKVGRKVRAGQPGLVTSLYQKMGSQSI
ncbi:hypothetical protein P3S67_026321 [Capsicum chacoense]